MSEMVERVARAMHARWDTDVEDALGSDNMEEAMFILARAAIAAFRDPTNAMVEAGAAAIRADTDGEAEPDDRTWAAHLCHHAMCDEALR